MALWKIESNPGKQLALNIAVCGVGVLLIVLCRHAIGHGFTNEMAGLLLGVLLLGLGVMSLVVSGKQTITVDPGLRRILIEDVNIFGIKSRELAFKEIIDARVSQLGHRSDGAITYYVSLKLITGKTYPLFFPAYYEGRWDRAVAESRCRRLQEYLQP